MNLTLKIQFNEDKIVL